jgi:uncharacterized protein (DUF885 family)
VLDRLSSVDRAALDHDRALSFDILLWQAEIDAEGLQYFWLQSFLTPYSSPLPALRQIFEGLPLNSAEDVEGYLELLQQVPDYVRDIRSLAQGQMERGVVVSRESMPAVTGLVRATVQPAEAGPFAIAPERLASLSAEDVTELRTRMGRIIDSEINPTLERLTDFLQGDYSTQAPSGVGVSQYPGGADYYRYLTRRNTTMNVSPEEVQEAGYALLTEMHERMAEIQRDVGFRGSRQEFHAYLKSNSRFFPATPEEVAQRLQETADSMFNRIETLFINLPQAPFGVRRLHPALEPTQTYGYYSRPTAAEPTGYYNYNGSKLDQRSWLNLEAVSLHELIPGHHFHIARQTENNVLPAFRTNTYHTAFTEGWGSYSSYLGLEAGLYQNLYSRYGMYVLESFLATRLVVDPGMNYFGWTLEEARQFMRENTLESETQIATESLRYSTDMPGQALGYQMGKRQFLALRGKAEAGLGDTFDIREFHEAIMTAGSLPMVVLEKHVDWFVEQRAER